MRSLRSYSKLEHIIKKTKALQYIIYYLALTTTIQAGKYSGELMSLGVGSRACGMGSAYTAIADDGFAAWWNPAGIVKNKRPWLAIMRASTVALDNFNFIAVGYPRKKWGYAISVSSLGIDSIPELPDTLVTNPIGFFSDRELVALLSCAYKYNRNTEIGVSVKHINYNLYNTRGMGQGVDFGITHKKENVLIGLTLKDIGGTKIEWETGQKDFRQMNCALGTGVGYRNFIISVDIAYEYSLSYRIGAEYSLLDLLFLRLGFNKYITAGVGTQIYTDVTPIVGIKYISIDYAFSAHILGATHRISATFTR